MDYQFYRWIAPLTALFVLLALTVSWRYRKERIARTLLVYLFSVLGLVAFNYLELISNWPQRMVFYAQMEHFFLLTISVSWFVFCLQYTGYDAFWKERKLEKLFLVPYTLIPFIFTNPLHHLFWTEYNFRLEKRLLVMIPDYGPIFWVALFLYYALLISGALYVIIAYIRGGSLYRKQALWVLIGFLFPLVLNLIYVNKVFPQLQKDYSPVAFSITGLFIFLSVFRMRLLSLNPLARNIVLNDLEDRIITLDEKKRIIDFNRSAAEDFLLDKQNLGHPCSATLLGDFIGEQNLSDSFSKNIEETLPFNDRTYQLRINRIETHKKNRGLMVCISDISNKMQLIEELEASNRQLQNLQSRLIQQEKMAAVGQLAAGVAHEVNNPLSFIKSNFGYSERLLNQIAEKIGSHENNEECDQIQKKIREILEILNESKEGIDRIADVVKELLGFSRYDSREKKTIYQLNQGIERTLVLIRGEIEKTARIDLDLGEVPSIYSRGNEINQILLNLIRNAVQSFPDRRNTNFIAIKSFTMDSLIICEISDNGTAITAEQASRLFDPFYTTKAKGEGTGLGLCISREIIEQGYGGALYLKDSTVKTFRLEIPISQEEEKQPPSN